MTIGEQLRELGAEPGCPALYAAALLDAADMIDIKMAQNDTLRTMLLDLTTLSLELLTHTAKTELQSVQRGIAVLNRVKLSLQDPEGTG